MPVVFLIMIVAVLVGIFFAATGRGGELAYEHADHAPLDLGPVSAADVALLRPPTALWGYNMQVTDEALDRIARAMRERDVTIAYLQGQFASVEPHGSYAESRGAPAQQAPGGPLAPEFPSDREISEPSGLPEAPYAPEAVGLAAIGFATVGLAEASHTPDAPETFEPPQPVAAAEPAETVQAPGPPRTPLILKASPAGVAPAPEPHEATQPSEVRLDPEAQAATQPSEVRQDPEAQDATQPSEAQAATQPSQALAPHEALGPQGSFDTHDWWAEQQAAAREEEAGHQAAGPTQAAGPAREDTAGHTQPAAGPAGAAEDDSLAVAEEQGW
ncbi:MAG: hypothetical protein ACRDNT_00440 [Streptosporangiaceae bacterium]